MCWPRAATGAAPVDDTMLTQLRVRSALANRHCGNFKQAFDLYEQVLADRNAMLNVQMDAARDIPGGRRAGQPGRVQQGH